MHAADPPVPLQHADAPAGSTAVPPADVPADLQGLAELTIVVPTYQRPDALARLLAYCAPEIGRASCRERVCSTV